jgi:hypothetical protein
MCVLLATQFVGGICETETIARDWEDNVKMNHLETEQEGGESADLDQDKDKQQALVSTVMNFRVP